MEGFLPAPSLMMLSLVLIDVYNPEAGMLLLLLLVLQTPSRFIHAHTSAVVLYNWCTGDGENVKRKRQNGDAYYHA